MEMNREDLTRVSITLMDGVTNVKKMQGSYVYLPQGQRLSDIMNDGRSFLPVYKLDTMASSAVKQYDVVLINKVAIAMIEELDEGDNGYGYRRY